jgi:membrane protein implicated in regulation of membrane protease activity
MDWLNDFLKPELIWFAVGLVLLVAEFIVPGLIIAFFAVGAWIVAGVCLATPISLNAQLGLFIISSVILLA